MNNTRGVTKHTEHRNTERGGEEFTNRVFNDTNGGQGSQAGKTFKDQPTLTERTGAFKDRVTRERLGYLRNPRSLKEGTET